MLDLSVVIAGSAGEGVQTIGEAFARAVLRQGYPVFTTQEYESRIRGGQSSYRVRITESVQNAPRPDADLLLALNGRALSHYRPLLRPGGILLAEGEEAQPLEATSGDAIAIPFARTASERFGTKLYSNSVAAGALVAALGVEIAPLEALLREAFARKGEGVVLANVEAARAGFGLASERLGKARLGCLPRKDRTFTLLSSNEAIPLAAAYAGCRFIAAYPMSPSTEIITTLARDEELGVFAEQAEDEIAAINMAIGASYAGARAMTATSGGGFALMVEATSLAGMTETPLVIVLAQRPGPATGLPTRTEQGDLLFAIHAGHGEFPKLVLAPSDPEEAFEKTVRAFSLADRYQIPVLVLTDQFLADSHFSFEAFRLPSRVPGSHLADPTRITAYRRYELTPNGISPRLYPGQSKHLVCLDSDEHDEEGHITEDLAGMRKAMVEKRLAKMRGLKEEVAMPETLHTDGAEVVLVGWGSTRGAILEAVNERRAAGEKVGMIHFTEVFPLPQFAFPEGETVVVVEGNATGQFARLLRAEYGVVADRTVHRYDGLPITSEDVERGIDGA
jgi:2-oxoglutarate ferredoxin oxidoreductase subunit alpha